jgi:hypothetical protein
MILTASIIVLFWNKKNYLLNWKFKKYIIINKSLNNINIMNKWIIKNKLL